MSRTASIFILALAAILSGCSSPQFSAGTCVEAVEKQYNRNSGKPLIVNIGNKITLEVKSTPGNSLERVYLGRNDNMNIGLNENSIFIIMINNQMKTYKSNGKNVLTLSYENTTCKAA